VEKVSVSEFKARLSHYLRLVQEGHVVVVEDRGKPVARVCLPGVRPMAGSGLGLFAGQIHWDEDAFDAMPDDEAQALLSRPLVAFGEGSKAAEVRRTYDAGGGGKKSK
jgi:antitoxin (DNA-binding transcriptional repressor) of toxin-antitoxin stability system